ncbi:hypothetical protein BH11GEM1_BH11GEM1_22830 [soil metagenome]
MVNAHAQHLVSTRTSWLTLLAGPIAWMADEGIALVIEANVCSGPVHATPGVARVALVVVALAALAGIALAALTATRALRAMDSGDHADSVRLERSRFLTIAALLLAGVAAFGVALRLVAVLAGVVCG